MTEHRSSVFTFADVEVREREFCVVKDGEVLSVEPRAFRVLLFLLHHPHKLVSKDELLDAVWKDCSVSENSLTRSVALLRRVLGDDTHEPRYIATVPKVGYRFLCDVQVTEDGFFPLGASTPNGDAMELADAAEKQAPEHHAGGGQRRSKTLIVAGLSVSAVIVLIAGLLTYRAMRSRATHPTASSVANSPPAKMRIVPLTNLPGDAWGPAFSPDGKQVAFFWNAETPAKSELYVQLVGGQQPLQLTHTRSGFLCCADWSPDGREIVFGRCDDNGGAVFTIPVLGGPQRKLTDVMCPYLPEGGYPKWTVDGKALVLADRCTPDGMRGIVLFSLATGEKLCLHAPPRGDVGDFGPVLSPDGKTVAFLRSSTIGMSEIYTVALSGGDLRQLTHDGNVAWHLMWSSDGKRIIFKSSRNGSQEPWQIPATGGRIEPETVYPKSGALSRDGRRLAYVDYSRSSASSTVWRADLSSPGGKVVAQTRILAFPSGQSAIQLSPDGQQIVFESPRERYQIWKSEADGSNPLQLTFFEKGFAGTPRWSSDGKWIAFDYANEHSQIYVIDAEGRNLHGITSGNYENSVPSWSRDGSAIYFASNRTGPWQIWRRELSDGKETQITHDGGFAAFESYDAKALYYSRFDGGGLWSVPVGGGAEQHLTEAPHRGNWGHFAVTDTGLYLVDSSTEPGPTILYYDFQNRRLKPILMLKQNALNWSANLSASRDGRTLFFAQVESRNSIMMADNLQ